MENGHSTTYAHTGLSANSPHTYRVRSVDDMGFGDWSHAVSVYTLASFPVAGQIGAVSMHRVSVSWLANGNPAGTQYSLAAFDLNDALVSQNGWTTGSSDTVEGLVASTEYAMKVKARNGDDVETGWAEIGVATTLSSLPPPEIEIPSETGAIYNVTFTGRSVGVLGARVFTLTYDPEIIQLYDLCALTHEKELTPGEIIGTGVSILGVSPGEIVFEVDKDFGQEMKWSGLINIFRFIGLQTQATTITIGRSP